MLLGAIVALLLALSGSGPTPEIAPISVLGNRTVAISSNDLSQGDVHRSYYDEFVLSAPPARNFTGDVANCQPGTISPAYAQDVVDRLNWYRDLAGVDGDVVLNRALDGRVQQAAMIMAAGDFWHHHAPANTPCRTDAGATAIERSNLSRIPGAGAVDEYFVDWGAGNEDVGHRRMLLHPELGSVGVGEAPDLGTNRSVNAIQTWDGFWDGATAQPEAVVWPTAGSFPEALVPPRWSITVRDADFTNASVSVTRNGTPISVTVLTAKAPTSTDPVDPLLVFELATTHLPATTGATQYTVTVSNVKAASGVTSYTWTVNAFDGDVAPHSSAAPSSQAPGERLAPSVINATFEDLVGRPPTENEVVMWSQATANERAVLVNDLANSDVWVGAVVDDLYLATLGRAPDAAGRQFWIDQIRAGMPVRDVAARFFASPEYFGTMTSEQWIVDLYVEILGRQPDAEGLAYWNGQIAATSEASVATRLYQMPESRERRVALLFAKLLDRSPDNAGHAYWAERLLEVDDISLATFLVNSDEYVSLNS